MLWCYKKWWCLLFLADLNGSRSLPTLSLLCIQTAFVIWVYWDFLGFSWLFSLLPFQQLFPCTTSDLFRFRSHSGGYRLSSSRSVGVRNSLGETNWPQGEISTHDRCWPLWIWHFFPYCITLLVALNTNLEFKKSKILGHSVCLSGNTEV